MRAAINRRVSVLGTGSYLPEKTVTNEVLEDLCSNFDAERAGPFSNWVDRVTHIHERRYIDGESTGDMGAAAAKEALDMAGIRAGDLDMILHATFTPSACVPGDHVLVAKALGADTCPSRP